MKPIKLKKCKICKNEFSPFQTTQRVCGVSCSLVHAREKENKKNTAKHQELKREFKLNDIKLRKKTAQAAFNKFIRLRDKSLPCISCQRHHSGQYHAGHFKTTGAHSELRFNEDNCHKQCSVCNNHLSGNIENYRPNLIKKIGRKAFDILEGPHSIKKYSPADYKEIELHYKAKLKALIAQ